MRIEVRMSNSAGIFQVDELLAAKLQGSGLARYIEVVARVEAETRSGWRPSTRSRPARSGAGGAAGCRR